MRSLLLLLPACARQERKRIEDQEKAAQLLIEDPGGFKRTVDATMKGKSMQIDGKMYTFQKFR